MLKSVILGFVLILLIGCGTSEQNMTPTNTSLPEPTEAASMPMLTPVPTDINEPTLTSEPERVAQTNADGMPGVNLCIDAPASAVPPDAQAQIEQALSNGVAQHPFYESMLNNMNNAEPPIVDIGCPGPATIYSEAWQGGGKGAGTSYVTGAPYRVETASPYFVYVFIAPAEDIQTAFGAAFPRRTGQEVLCFGDNCATINSAIYLTPEEFADQQTLVEALTWGLGFE